MKSIRWMIVVALATVIIVNLSCSTNQYNAKEHERYVDSFLPVDTVDASHTWMLAETRTITLTANAGTGAEKVQILTENPRSSGDAEVVGEAFISDGESTPLSISYPSTYQTLYAALVDAQGRYTLTPFTPSTAKEVDFSSPLFTSEALSYRPQAQQFVYGFEDSYPMPGEYDYNNVVLKIAQERTGEREMRYTVTLAAVGTTNQVGAAIRLLDFSYDEIESVETVDGESFNVNNGKDVPSQMVYVMVDSRNNVMKQTLQRGLNGEAVIGLFVDAHWATGDVLEESYGQIPRKKYNVSKTSGGDMVVMVPRTVTYVVTYKEGSRLYTQTLGRLDPFIVEGYNGGKWEIHTYDYRKDNVFFRYSYTDMNTLPWALMVPSAKFRHPLDRVAIGYMEDGYLFGAYSYRGHSFGEWTANREAAKDWYLYPGETRVF